MYLCNQEDNLNFMIFLPYLPSTGILGVCHHVGLVYTVLRTDLSEGFCVHQASIVMAVEIPYLTGRIVSLRSIWYIAK